MAIEQEHRSMSVAMQSGLRPALVALSVAGRVLLLAS
jgi:hypothetical protein